MTLNRVFTVGAIAVVIVGLVLAFVFLGTPGHQRLISIDKHRVGDLVRITNLLNDRYPKGGLPASLPESIVARDPVTKRNYEYRRVDATHYMLCAVFATSDRYEDGNEGGESYVAFPQNAWRHGTGNTCYKVDVTQTTPVPNRVRSTNGAE